MGRLILGGHEEIGMMVIFQNWTVVVIVHGTHVLKILESYTRHE